MRINQLIANLQINRSDDSDVFYDASDKMGTSPCSTYSNSRPNHPNQLLDRRLRLESVPNALEQARTAASFLCSRRRPYASVPWFWSDQYDIKLQIVGLKAGYDEKVVRGDHSSGRSFVVFYFKERSLVSAECVNRPKEFLLMKHAMAKGLKVDIALLADETVAVKDLIIAQET